MWILGRNGTQARKPPSLAKTVAGTKNGTVSRERRPEYNHCFHRARRLWRAGIRVRVRPAYILGRAKSRSGPGGSIVAGGRGLQVAPTKGLDPKLPRGSCRSASTRVRPIAGGRVSNVVNKFRSGAELLSFSVTAGRREIQRESPPNLTNGQETGKIFQRKVFHVLTVFFLPRSAFLARPRQSARRL